MLALAAPLMFLTACDEDDPDAPPTITYGVSVCTDCDMIISDERYAAATIVADSRGRPESLLFDDIGDQTNYESSHEGLTILSHWVHDHTTREWLRAEDAIYVRSPALRTPMASGLAAFASQAKAETAASELAHADVLTFADLFSHPTPPPDSDHEH
jgi:copper chaperone NosL